MTDWNRREFGAAMAAFALLAGRMDGQEGAPQPESPGLDSSRVYKFSEMKVNHSANGGWGRPVMHGTLPTGEFVEVHETMLPAGQMPHPPHKHRNSEFLLIREGDLQYLNEGVAEPVSPGDVIYSASNRMHGLKNVGSTPALYFVVSVSHGQM